MEALAYRLYLLFTISYFVHLAARIKVLGVIRFDLITIALITILLVASTPEKVGRQDKVKTTTMLFVLLGYVIITLPFVTWPGSVLRTNFAEWVKAAIFYFFTIGTITTEKRLRTFLFIFIGCQVFRVAEPVYLHLHEGYWGSITSMGDWKVMNRLSGAPYDVVNPNGLAEVAVTAFLFLHYSATGPGKLYKVLYVMALPMLIYALVLTGSRSGMIALGVTICGIMYFGRKKALVGVITIVAAVLIFGSLSPLLKDRYLSTDIFRSGLGSTTAVGRIEGWKRDIRVGIERPVFGHGLGTSAEALFHVYGIGKPSHNLYTQVFIDLGLIGEIIWIIYLVSVVRNCRNARLEASRKASDAPYLWKMTIGIQVWVIMMLVFSLASYGLLSYEWYLIGGLTVAVGRITGAIGGEEDVTGTEDRRLGANRAVKVS